MEEYNNQKMTDEGAFLDKPIDREEQRRKREEIRKAQEAERWEKLKNIPMPGKKTITAILIVAVVAVVLAVVYSIVGSFFGPGRVAEEYFKAALSGDWETVYEQIEVPEGELMSKENFLAVHSEDGTDVKNLKVEKVNESDFTCQYKAVYMLPGESNEMEDTVTLVKQNEKTLLLFPKWKVSSEAFVASNYPIYAPEGYAIKVDGVELTPSQTGAGSEDEYGSYAGDTYRVDLFVGTHTMEISAENREPSTLEFNVSRDSEGYTVDQLALSEEAVADMQTVVKNFMSQLYVEAIQESGPSQDYMDYWVSDAGDLQATKEIQNSARYLYEDFTEQLHSTRYDSIKFTDMQFENYQSEISDSYTMENGALTVQLYVTYEYSYAYTVTDTSYDGITSTENESNDGTDEMTVTLMQEEGQWKIYSTNMNCVY